MLSGREVIELHHRLESCEGTRVTKKIDAIRMSYEVFRKNYQRINVLLERYRSDTDFALQLIEDTVSKNDFFTRITTDLHNFLASVKTLVDHTRVIIREEYSETDFGNECEERKNQTFIGNNLVSFVQNLRNFALHKKLPITGARMTFSADESPSQDINLPINELIDWDGWNTPSQTFIEQSGNAIILKDILDEYVRISHDFYHWFFQRQLQFHNEALEELDEINSALESNRQDYLRRIN
jgi:hypothetical protein